jgi:hypothetical protein
MTGRLDQGQGIGSQGGDQSHADDVPVQDAVPAYVESRFSINFKLEQKPSIEKGGTSVWPPDERMKELFVPEHYLLEIEER